MTAFLLRENEPYLSVNWLMSEGDIGIDRSVDKVRAAFVAKGYGLRKNGRFAILNVGMVRQALPGICVRHKPEGDDLTHSGICGFTKDQEWVVALRLRMLMLCVYPAIK